MSDIEIEEHDVLDNPTIRSIFPDLSILKKEITQYEEGLSNTDERLPQAVEVDITLGKVPAGADDVADLKYLESSQQVSAIINILDEDSDDEETLDATCDTSAGPVYQKRSPLVVVNTLDIDTHKQPTKCNTPTSLECLESSPQSHVTKRLEIHRRFKTFLDSLADDISDSVDNVSGTSNHCINDNYPASPLNGSRDVESSDRDVNLITKNVYILGSKPSIKQPQPRKECKQIKIMLKNIGPYLNESKQYCRICHTLFPSPASFKIHLSKIHFPNSSNTIGGAQKSPVTQFQCDICTINLSTKHNLQRHLRMVHNFKNAKKISSDVTKVRSDGDQMNTAVKACDAKETSKTNVKYKNKNKESHNCFHCEKIFESRNSLIEHLYDVINPNNTVSENSTKRKQTSTGLKTFTDKNVDEDKDIVKTKKIECSSCAINFNTQKQLEHHNNKSHSISNMDHINKNSSNKRSSIQQSKSAVSNESKKCETVKQNRSFKKENKINTRRKNDSAIKYNNDSESDSHFASDDKYSSDSVSEYEEKTKGKKCTNYNNVGKKMYQCFICSYYSNYFQWFSGHMAGHNIKEVLREDKVVFKSKCKLCTLKIPNIRHYNDHIVTCHSDILSKKITLEDKGFHSVLFKCIICNIHFLSANAATCHTEHAELSVNWRCDICEHLFKLRDKPLHLKQHSISKNIAIYDLCASALKRILYKCLKCAVHFSEEQYFIHYSTCDLQIPYSTYCHICDILINKNDMESHECNHKEQNIQPKDFTFIESEILKSSINLNQKISNSIYVDTGSSFAFTFCHHCKCFIRGLGNKAEVHKDGRCAKTLSPRLCNQCGLVLTPRGCVSHELLHNRVKNLNLQTLFFFDMESKKPIRPPIPKFPNCNICEVHFVNRLLIREHECEKQSYIQCEICEMKLTEEAFKLHINYHNYQLANETQSTQSINKVETNGSINSSLVSGKAKLPDETQNKELSIHQIKLNEPITNSSKSVKANGLPDETENIQLNNNKVDTNEEINSSYISNMDELPNEIQNTQLNMNKVGTNGVVNNSTNSVKAKLPHINETETIATINNSSMQDPPKLPDETQNTQLIIDKVDTSGGVNITSESVRATTPEIQIVNIDEETAVSSKSVRAITPEIQIVNIDEETTGPQTKILFNCIICNVTVDTYDAVVLHCHSHYDSKEIRISENKNMPSIDDKLGLFLKYDPFYFRFDNDVWIQHIFLNVDNKQVSEVLEKSIYKFESRFKMDEMQPGTSDLVLYRCCLCRVHIDPCELYSHVKLTCTRAKKYQCSQCGLYFNSINGQILHVRLFHKHLDLNMTSYKIILYNKKEDEEFTKIMLNSINKFVMYQCRACNVIVGKLQRVNHQCDNTHLVKCSSCGLIFYLDEFISHRNKHQSITNFKFENMIVVLFGKPVPQKVNKLKPSFTGTIIDLTYYKCVTCGMCSKYKNHKYKHSCDTNSSKCPKCSLMFSIRDFYEHTDLHENHLELGYEDFHWNIVTYDLSTRLFRKINKASDSDIAQKKNKAEEQINEAEKTDATEKIYKCTCGLHFLEEMSARKHNHRVKMSKQICFKCHLLFTPGELFNHLLKHHSDKKVKYNYDIINISED